MAEDAELRIVLRVLGDELLRGMADMKAAVTSSIGETTGGLKRLEAQSAQSHAAVVQHTQTVGSAFGTLRERVTVGLSGIQASLRAYGEAAAVAFAFLAGERAFANIIRSTQEWAFSVEHLAKLLGVSTEEASVYAVAAKEAGVGTEVFDRAAKGLIRTLNTKPEAFKNIGVDIAEFKTFPTLLEATLNAVDRYKEGIDRLRAAQSVFGGRIMPESLEALRRWVAELPHAREVAAAFHVVIGEEGVAAARAYQRAQADLELVTLGFKEVLAEALRPELENVIAKITQLAKDGTLLSWARVGAAEVKTLGEDMAVLGKTLADHLDAFKGTAAAILAWESIKGLTPLVLELGAAFRALAVALGLVSVAEDAASLGITAVIKLVVASAVGLITYEEAWGKVGRAIQGAAEWYERWQNMPTLGERLSGDTAALERYQAVLDKQAAAHAAAAGGPAAPGDRRISPATGEVGIGQTLITGEEVPTSYPEGTKRFAQTADQAAKAEKKAYEDLKATRDADLASAGNDLAQKLRIEQHYALEVLTLGGATKAQQLAAAKALSEATQRLSAEDRVIALGHLREELSEKTKALDEEKKGLEEQLRQGVITAPQFLAMAQELADRRLAIIRAMYAAETEAAEGNRRELAAIDDRLAAAEAANARERQENERKAAAAILAAQKENAKLLGEVFGSLGQAFNTALESAVDGTRSRAEVMRSIWQGLLKDALKIVEQIAATWAKQGIVNALGPPGTKTKATGQNLNEQFGGAVAGFLGFGGGDSGTGKADPRVAKEKQTQTQLTAEVQHGEQQRQQITLFSLARQLATWIQTGLSKLVHWIAVELGITTATVTSAHVREAIAIEAAAVDATSAAAGAAATKSAATTEATSNAYAGAAGAANAVASIPYAGPILAVLNYATVLATLLGAVRGIASAEGGMEDTGSSALMTMLHPREMVLPASIAETVRRGTGSTSTATGGEVHHHHNSFTIHAVDAHSFEQLLRRKPHVIADIAARGVSARPARGRHP